MYNNSEDVNLSDEFDGRQLVELVMSYIEMSRNGINEAELIECLKLPRSSVSNLLHALQVSQNLLPMLILS